MADKKGEGPGEEKYEEDLKDMSEQYKIRDEAGDCFVHIRKKHSSNRDLKVLSSLTKGAKFHTVNLHGGEAESVITNSHRLANVIEAAACDSCESLEKTIEKEVRGREASGSRIRKDSSSICSKKTASGRIGKVGSSKTNE